MRAKADNCGHFRHLHTRGEWRAGQLICWDPRVPLSCCSGRDAEKRPRRGSVQRPGCRTGWRPGGWGEAGSGESEQSSERPVRSFFWISLQVSDSGVTPFPRQIRLVNTLESNCSMCFRRVSSRDVFLIFGPSAVVAPSRTGQGLLPRQLRAPGPVVIFLCLFMALSSPSP